MKYKAAVLGTLLLGAASNATAQSVDEDFEQFVFDACNSLMTFTQEQQNFCIDVFSGGNQSSSSGASTAGNFGIAAQTGGAAVKSINTQREDVERRTEELRAEGNTHNRRGLAAGDWSFGRVGAFLAYQVGGTDREQTARENGFESDLKGISGGLDYRLTDQLIVGAAYGVTNEAADFIGRNGHLRTHSKTLTGYVTFLPMEDLYVSGYAGIGRNKIDTVRLALVNGIFEIPTGETDSDQKIAGGSIGYDWYFDNNFNIGTSLDIDYAKSDVEAYTESSPTLGLSFQAQKVKSLQSTIGLRLGYTHNTSWGFIAPEVRLGWVHEHQDDSRAINSSLPLIPGPTFTTLTDSPDRNFYRWGAGVTVGLPYDSQAFIDYEEISGHRFRDTWSLNVGIATEF